MDFDILSFLSDPTFAVQMAALFVFAIAAIAWYAGDPSRRADSNLYWRWMVLGAEVCASLGLIGLVTYAGREYEEARKATYASNVRSAEHEMGIYQSRVWGRACMPSPQKILQIQGSGHLESLCETLRSSFAIYDPNTNWDMLRRRLADISQARAFDPQLVVPTQLLVQAMVKMSLARSDYAAYIGEANARRNDSNRWIFLLFASFFAGIAVALKCARAFHELCETIRKKKAQRPSNDV